MQISIPSLYAEYGRYCNQYRSIVGHIDCLKPVERRLLVTVFKHAKKKTKSAKVVGMALAVHPHGDASTYGALAGLVNRGFVEGQGNFGAQQFEEDSKPAAMRYTEVKSSAYVADMAFKYIKYVPWEVLEIEEEPLYLPCPVPLGLIDSGDFASITQGISFETVKMPRYTFSDLITRLHELLIYGEGKTTIKPHCYKNNIVEVNKGDFEKLLTTGQAALWYCPEYKANINFIDIFSRNPDNGFSKLRKLWRDYPKNLTVQDLSSESMLIRVYSRLGPVTNQFIKTIVEAISTKIHFKCNTVDEKGTVEIHSIDDLLLRSYQMWLEAWRAKLNEDLNKLNARLHHLHVIQVIRDCYDPKMNSISDIVAVFKQKQSQGLYKDFYEDEIYSVSSKGSIKQLIETKLDINSVKMDITSLQGKIKNLDKDAVTYIGGLK